LASPEVYPMCVGVDPALFIVADGPARLPARSSSSPTPSTDRSGDDRIASTWACSAIATIGYGLPSRRSAIHTFERNSKPAKYIWPSTTVNPTAAGSPMSFR